MLLETLLIASTVILDCTGFPFGATKRVVVEDRDDGTTVLSELDADGAAIARTVPAGDRAIDYYELAPYFDTTLSITRDPDGRPGWVLNCSCDEPQLLTCREPAP